MVELGQLERRHEELSRRHARVVVASVEGLDDAQKTQQQYPHLVVLADADQHLVSTAAVGHPGAGQHGEDIAAPTTFIVDKRGIVRGLFRPERVITRLSVDEVLAALGPN
jgi:peroxiredoxin